MSAEADKKNNLGNSSEGASEVGKSEICRSKLPPPPVKPPTPEKVKVEPFTEKENLPHEEDSPNSRGRKPQVPKKPSVPPDKPASPRLSPAEKPTRLHELKSKKNVDKPKPPPGKPRLSFLKKSSLEEKTEPVKYLVEGRGTDDEEVQLPCVTSSRTVDSTKEAGRDISNGNIVSNKSVLGPRTSIGAVDNAREVFNLKVALKTAAEKKLSAEKKLTPPRKFVPSRLSSHSFSGPTSSSLAQNKSSDESSDDMTTNSIQKMTKATPSPSIKEMFKFWKPNKTPPSTNLSAPENQLLKSKKSKKTNRSRKASAKFYTDMDDDNRHSQASNSSNGSSTFYVKDNMEKDTEDKTQKELEASDESGDVGITNSPSKEQEEESPPKNTGKRPKPIPPPKKPFLQPKTSGISDVFSDSPPLPRKTVRNVSAAIRDSMVFQQADDRPIAPLRSKKKFRRPGPLQLTMDSSRDSSVERDLSPTKRVNSTSFTTDDFDVFQRSKSKDFDLEVDKPVEATDSKDEKEPKASENATGDKQPTKSLRRPSAGRIRDKEKRRSKSVGAPGFNIFGVKLKKVMPPAVEKSESTSSDGATSKVQNSPSWLHGHLSPEKMKLNLDAASGFYDNNFTTINHNSEESSIAKNSLGKPLKSPKENIYESIDEDDDTEESMVQTTSGLVKTGTDSSKTSHSVDKSLLSRSVDTDKSNVKSKMPDHQDHAKSQENSSCANAIQFGDQSSARLTGQTGAIGIGTKGVPPISLDLAEDTCHVVEHEYADIDSPISSLAKCKSIENLYDDVCQNDDYTTGHVSGFTEKTPTTTTNANKPSPPQYMGQKTLDVDKSDGYSSHASNILQARLERKLSRKLSRKVSRKLSRKLTKKFRENKYAKLQQLLNIDQDSDEEVDGEVEELSFSETDSDFDDDSFTDDSDLEFEQELLTKLAEDSNSELAEIYKAVHITPMSKVQRIATELLATERSYVDKLELLDQKFHFTIVLENRSHKMFPEEVIPHMFSNIKSIYQFHHDFLLPQLEKRMKEWEQTPKIGDVMKKFAPFLKLYTEYVQNFDNANVVISSWLEKSPKFASLVEKIQRLPECENLSLQHHMLGPIQRVPRYELLLKEYLKTLTADSDDIEDTQKALELVTKAAQHSNETMRQNEKFRKLLDLNQALGSTVNLVSPTRELVKEGKITKIAARNGLSQERYIFLFNDKLVLCQSVPVTLGIMQQYKVKLLMDIDGMQVLEGDNLEIPNTFYVKSKQRILEFHTETSEEKLAWQMTLWNVITDFTKKMQSRGEMKDLRATFVENDGDLGKRAPKWIKDQETSQCMLCATVFTIIKRRHHCRACGKVVCGRCSNYEARLAYDNNKSKRVCGDCHSKLATSHANVISSPSLTQPVTRRKGILNVKASDPCVISGYLQMTQDKKNWQKRFFAIHQDFVLFSFKAHQDVRALISMPLPGYVVEEAEEADGIDKTNTFKVSHKSPTGQKIYYFHADDRDTKQKWVNTLQHIVNAELPPGLVTERSVSVLSDISQKQEVTC